MELLGNVFGLIGRLIGVLIFLTIILSIILFAAGDDIIKWIGDLFSILVSFATAAVDLIRAIATAAGRG